MITRTEGDPLVEIHLERTIAAPAERVFNWLADPGSLTAAPLVIRAGWAKNSLDPGVGAIREVTTAGMWFREEITAYDRPQSYSYRIVRSFPALDHEGGTLTFTPRDGGTHVIWVSEHAHPARGGGKAMEAVTSRLFPWSFRLILDRCASVLES